jgi:hypothetical protein
VACYGSKRILFVEAKGETSNGAGSARHGKPFNCSQCRDHISNAFFSAATFVDNGQPGIALPNTRQHRSFVSKISEAVDRLGIWIFWVAADGTVSRHRSAKSARKRFPANRRPHPLS